MSNQDKDALAQQAVPEGVDLPDVESMAHSACQEALSFGVGHDVFHRWMRAVMDKTVTAMLAAAPAAPQAEQQVDAKDAERYRWLREHRDVTLLTAFFGNGCVNKYRDHIDGFIDAALASQPPVQPNGEALAAPQAEQQAEREPLTAEDQRDAARWRTALAMPWVLTGDAKDYHWNISIERVPGAQASDDPEAIIDAVIERAHGIGHHVPGQGSRP